MITNQLFKGRIASLHLGLGYGMIKANVNSATFLVRFFYKDAPQGLKVGTPVSFLNGNTATHISVLPDSSDNIIFVDFRSKARIA